MRRTYGNQKTRWQCVSPSLTQVLTNKEKVYLRIANERGWTYAKNPGDVADSVLFEEISGDIAEDTWVPVCQSSCFCLEYL